MFTKILIANRGEIACRVAATARRMGIQTVAVYSDADAHAAHVQACDEAVHVGGPEPKDSYLRWDRILAAALATGAQAVHPGYGFLSENAEFAQACEAAGLVFIGPPAQAIQAMGLKAQAKRLMAQAGVPLVPGYHGQDQDPALLQRHADDMGYPVLIKASAGGGGKGMRRVQRAQDFAAALASCQREAASSFGSDAVLIEKYVLRPRHIEVQVFADTQGNCVHLFERDCSVQRRHQKVLEEAPAPGMTQTLRAQMGAAAVAAARAVNYVGAGTVEFIVEQAGGYGLEDAQTRFYFMEMNTRLQVEHPVTEAITGLDLVAWQLRVAAGQALPLAQSEIAMRGHAIEARICAELPDKQFLPATGQLQVYRTPAAAHFAPGSVRLDGGVREGDAISPFYDPMLAKLIVHADSREQALAQMDAALAQMQVVGVGTNVQFLRQVVRCPSFATAQLDTALIEREAAVLFDAQPLGLTQALSAFVAHTLHAEQALQGSDPFDRRDGWQSHGVGQRRFEVLWRGQTLVAWLAHDPTGAWHLRTEGAGAGQNAGAGTDAFVQGQVWAGPLRFGPHQQGADPTANALWVQWGDAPRARSTLHWQGPVAHVFMAHGAACLTLRDPLAQSTSAVADVGRLTAPMPGKLVAFAVQVGQQVQAGQTLAVMEAMKMEHTIAAPHAGTVAELLYAAGDQVGDGAELLRLSAAAV